LFHLINRMDGAKMLALAALALAGVALARGGLLPRLLGYVAAALAAAMVASGVGYLLLSTTLAQAAAVSLGLLLIWVVGTGVALSRRSQAAGRCHAPM
jgi:small-conductance mechanosensitive channel